MNIPMKPLVEALLIGPAGELHHKTTLHSSTLVPVITRLGFTYIYHTISKGRYVYKQTEVLKL